ncbi:MAG TPA: tyrosine-type recombinase/integrase [Tepidisphaeraceae bacterium]|jgi:site-specific recombinase XerD|nr:tyrosine-type recombinase/integrase [Tepidisphaeraceae bacterium]
MVEKLPVTVSRAIARTGEVHMPVVIEYAGDKVRRRFLEFFTAEIRNPETRKAYSTDIWQFLDWCDLRRRPLADIDPMTVAAYVELLMKPKDDGGFGCSIRSTKRKLAAIRALFDYLVTGGAASFNPASSVRGPKLRVAKGSTLVLQASDAGEFLDGLDTSTVVGLRDRAIIGVMVYTFARVGAVAKLKVGDYYQNGKKWWLRLHEKGNVFNEVPVHHKAEEYLDAYMLLAGVGDDKKAPLFRSTIGKTGRLTAVALHPDNVLQMVKRRARDAGVSDRLCCHTWRGTGITAYIKAGGDIRIAQKMAGHASLKTTQIYDRSEDEVTLDEVERIVLN